MYVYIYVHIYIYTYIYTYIYIYTRAWNSFTDFSAGHPLAELLNNVKMGIGADLSSAFNKIEESLAVLGRVGSSVMLCWVVFDLVLCRVGHCWIVLAKLGRLCRIRPFRPLGSSSAAQRQSCKMSIFLHRSFLSN